MEKSPNSPYYQHSDGIFFPSCASAFLSCTLFSISLYIQMYFYMEDKIKVIT